jgi:hypothetical protein
MNGRRRKKVLLWWCVVRMSCCWLCLQSLGMSSVASLVMNELCTPTPYFFCNFLLDKCAWGIKRKYGIYLLYQHKNSF